MSDQPRVGFWHGVLAGFAGLIVLVQLSFAIELAGVRAMYADFGDVELPLLTRVTLHPAWLWGAPVVGAAAVGALLVKRPRTVGLYVLVALVVVGLAAVTYYFPRAPMYALAGNIRAD